MPTRRQRRKARRTRDQAIRSTRGSEVEVADRVDRLAYTREQAAEALGVSLSTLDRRVVPAIATVVTEWGARLIPVRELERYLAERTQPPPVERPEPRLPGRRVATTPELVARIRGEHAGGMSLSEIARRLNAEGVRTSQGGRQWWPSTVRAVLARSTPPLSAQDREPTL